MHNKYVLVVGSQGFVGQHLSRLLILDGYSVIGMDIKAPSDEIAYVKYIQKSSLDITVQDVEFLKEYSNYGLINVSGVSRNGDAKNNPMFATTITLNGFIHLLECLEDFTPSWMIQTSTREVDMLLDNSSMLRGKQKLYPMLKYSSEKLAQAYAQEWNIPLHIMRLSDIFGVGDHSSKVMSIFFMKAIKGEVIEVHNAEIRLFLSEVSEVCLKIIASIGEGTSYHCSYQNLWDEAYSISLLELAHLALELNPTSSSTIVCSENFEVRSIKNRLTPLHVEVLEAINSSFILMNNDEKDPLNH